jgi:VWFA-related protein
MELPEARACSAAKAHFRCTGDELGFAGTNAGCRILVSPFQWRLGLPGKRTLTPQNQAHLRLLILSAIAVIALASPVSAAFAQSSGQNSTGSSAGAVGQAPSSPPPITTGPNGEYTLRTSVTEVVLYATVLDKHQNLVTSLTKKDFSVYEDGVPQVISSFEQRDVPVSLGTLIDDSGSMAPKRAAVDRAAVDLIRASNPDDETFIVNFSDEAFLDQDFTSNIGLLEKALSHVGSSGGTALYDALIASANHLAEDGTRRKQAILIVTDGEDNSSSGTLQDAVRRIQKLNGPIVYSIGLLYGQGGTDKAKKALQTLSDQTGGIAFFPKSLDQVDSIAKRVARDIRQQYIIGYQPSRPIRLGGYRSIRVVASAKGYGKLTVRTRAGYLAGPPSQ